MTESRVQPRVQPRVAPATATGRERRILLRVGALCAIAGPLLLAASFAPHGDLPTNEASLLDEGTALRYIADHRSWLLIHLGTVLAGLTWIGAFAALAGTLHPGPARAVGRLLLPSAIVGGIFVVFDYAVDGFALKILADEWATADGPRREALQRMAETGIWLLTGSFHNEIVVFYGLTVLLAGLAVALDGGFPRWFGAVGAVAGGAVLLNGLAGYAGVSLVPAEGLDFLVFVMILPIEAAWLLALGLMLWRRASRASLYS